MRILLFGTGDYYQKYKKWFKTDDVLALIDNDVQKQGRIIDGLEVLSVCDAIKLNYDYIIILSIHEEAMREQLINKGVQEEKIYKFSELYLHPEIIQESQPITCYLNDEHMVQLLSGNCAETILIMSYNLDLCGATLALYYAAKILRKNNYSVIFVSCSEGELKHNLISENIGVIVDPNLQIRTYNEIHWIQGYQRIICNTLNFYLFLSERNPMIRVLWWLHDPNIFYKSLDQKIMKKIDKTNLFVCAVGKISEKAFLEYFPDWEVTQLIYGIEDVAGKRIPHKKLEFVTIGNVQNYKGQDILIDALDLLPDFVHEKIHITIVGTWQSAFASEIKNRALNMKKMVTCLDSLNREEVYALLDYSDVLICPSRVDTMSIVSNEAMQHSLPCIVSNSTGVSAYITDGVDGIIFESGNVKHLADKIMWCLNNQEKLTEMGQQSRKIYEKYFSMEVFERNFLHQVENCFQLSHIE